MADQAIAASSAVSIANSTDILPALRGSTERIKLTPQNIRDFSFNSTSNSTFSGPVSFGGNTADYVRGTVTVSTGTGAVTLTSTMSGQLLYLNSSSTTKTVVAGAALTAGFNCTITSGSTSDVVFVSSGGTLRHPSSHTRLRMQFATAAVFVPSTGEHFLAGNTST